MMKRLVPLRFHVVVFWESFQHAYVIVSFRNKRTKGYKRNLQRKRIPTCRYQQTQPRWFLSYVNGAESKHEIMNNGKIMVKDEDSGCTTELETNE